MSHLPYPEDQHDTRLLMGDPAAIAYEWIKGYAENLNRNNTYEDDGSVTVDELIETALDNLESNSRWGGDYLSKGGLLEGVSTDPTFWDKLAILKEIEIPHEKRNNFFSCSC
jgi:hypothetical protein